MNLADGCMQWCNYFVTIHSIMCLYIIYQRRKLKEMQRKYFKQHGGYELEEKMKLEKGLDPQI